MVVKIHFSIKQQSFINSVMHLADGLKSIMLKHDVIRLEILLHSMGNVIVFLTKPVQ